MQLLPAATGVLSLQAVLVLNATRAKSPVVPMFVIVRADVPVMVMVEVPGVAFAEAVSVSVLVVVVGFGLNPAVTPVGKPVAFRVTLPLKPFRGATVMVLVPLLP